LNNHFSFEGLKILDLFAGTGNISYEFIQEEVRQSLLMVILLCKFIQASGNRI
jgi:16S rRNA G966 N2-methylase RsmD